MLPQCIILYDTCVYYETANHSQLLDYLCYVNNANRTVQSGSRASTTLTIATLKDILLQIRKNLVKLSAGNYM